ncbi:energy transducer TonB [Oleiagrimonas sp. C23AA]|uniref:energy transducer TonB family protein n=1 Tax=Oleiagrimonas sp. C23AA TaxID=2719047 RepID=UPI001421F6FF|nr:energy transducer TonB [Oleiagrimonas sp. C23AA]NII10868.1 energy transducer TonB [Oleiagrimonas sp. C23AA]
MLMAAVLALAGCQHAVKPTPPPPPAPKPNVSYEAVKSPQGVSHYKVKTGHQMVGAAFVHHVVPVYPKALVPQQLPPTSVTATLVANAQGTVTRVLIPAMATDTPDQQAFDHAVREAVRQWRFSPLHDSLWKTEPDGTSVRVDDGPGKPFSLTYRFHFKLVDGKPVVQSSHG